MIKLSHVLDTRHALYGISLKLRNYNKLEDAHVLEQATGLLEDMHAENMRLSGQCGRYYRAIREHCKGINRLLRKRDHHRNKADRYAVALQRIIDYPAVSGGVSNIITPYEIADAALNPPKDSNMYLEKKVVKATE